MKSLSKPETKDQQRSVLGNSTHILNHPQNNRFKNLMYNKVSDDKILIDNNLLKNEAQQDVNQKVHLPFHNHLNNLFLQNNQFIDFKNELEINKYKTFTSGYPQTNFYYQYYQQQDEKKNKIKVQKEEPNGHHNLFGNFNYSLPANFNPRGVANMSYHEKVTKWMDSIPIFMINDDLFENYCFTPEVNVHWEEDELDEFFDNYYEDFEASNINPLTTADEIINFQCKRFDCLNKKIYSFEKKEDN
ncbi:hypothetical protein QEN19_004388 [Hanseniaspora menglaensis]